MGELFIKILKGRFMAVSLARQEQEGPWPATLRPNHEQRSVAHGSDTPVRDLPVPASSDF